MKAIWPIALISFKEGLRQRVLYGVILFAFLFMMFAVLFSSFFMRDILKINLDLCLSAVSVGGLLVPFFLGINLLSGDIEQKTIYTLLARPVSRANYILGKFMGICMLAITIICILTCSTLLSVWGMQFMYTDYFLTGLSVQSILISCGMTLIGIFILNSTVVLWCSVTTSSFLATLLTLATYVVGQTVEDLVQFMSLQIQGVSISPFVKTTVQAVMYIFPNLAAFDFKQQAAHGLKIHYLELLPLVFYSVAYSSVVLVLAILFFRKRDLP